MAALSENIGVLFRIKADTADAVRGIRETKQEVGGLEKSAATAGSSFASMANPAALAAVAITAIATAAVTATKYLWDLTTAASEYGSKIFDASQKTGASVETIQALGAAAQQSGSSMDTITDSILKFTVLIGQAQLGNEKAQKTLAQFGITATDVDGALAQAVDSIYKMTDATKQNAASALLFKDRTGEAANTIRELGGNLPEAIKKLRDLGRMLSEEDTKAADAFGDSLDTLTQQVKTAGYKFAFEFMPQITSSIRQIIQWLSANSGEVRKWGQIFRETLSGVKVFMAGLLVGANAALNGINNLFGISARNAITWSTVMQGALGPIVALLRMISNVGSVVTDEVSAGTSSALSAVKAPGIQVPNMPTFAGGGSGAGGGGRAAKDTSEQDAENERRKAVAAAELLVTRQLAVFRAGNEKRIADLDQALELGMITEIEHVRNVARVKWEQIRDEITAKKELLKNDKLNNDEREEILQDLKVLTIELNTQAVKGSVEVTKQIQKEVKAQDELLQKEKDRLKVIKERNEERRKEEQLRQFNEKKERTAGAGIDAGFFNGIANAIDIMLDKTLNARDKMASALNQIKASWQSMGDVVSGAVNAFAQGIGSIVENLVLMGDAGPNAMRKLVASVLAGVAAQAAVLAVFELAKGFAALFFNPAEANAHFIAAAIFGSIAVGTGLLGRAVAGDAFKTQTASATGGSSGNNASPSETRYTTQFNGYGQGRDNILVRTLDRVNTTLGLVEETQHQFNRKVLGMSPTDVVVLGANGASREIRGAVESELSSDVGTTDGFMRGLGFAR